MHQDSATRIVIGTPLVILARRTLIEPPNCINISTLETEFGRIVQNHYRLVLGKKSFPCRLEMSCQNLFFAHTLVGEKPVGCIRVRPVLGNSRSVYVLVGKALCSIPIPTAATTPVHVLGPPSYKIGCS